MATRTTKPVGTSPDRRPRRGRLPLAPRGFAAPDLLAYARDELTPVVDRVVERIEPADQKSRDADVVVIEERLRDRLG
jgi:hypothetical protein